METRPEPEWDELPDLIESTTVAVLLGVKPQSLRMYVKRGQLARPAQRGENMTWYRKDDVRGAIERRNSKAVQGTQQALPEPQTESEQWRLKDAHLSDAAGLELVSLTQPLFAQMSRQAEALQQRELMLRERDSVIREKDETIRQLAAQVVKMNELLTEERNSAEQARREAAQAEKEKAEQPATKSWWRKLAGRP